MERTQDLDRLSAPKSSQIDGGTHEVPPPTSSVCPAGWLPNMELSGEHRQHLKASGLTDETIEASGIKTAKHGYQVVELDGFDPGDAPAMVIPYPDPSGVIDHYRIRPDDQRDFQDPAKYRTAPGATNRLYLPAPVWEVADDSTADLVIVEGEKKALAGLQCGFNAIGVAGVYGWRCKEHGTIPDLDRLKWRDRNLTIAFDSDMHTNPQVREALRRLAAELERRGAHIRVAVIPDEGESKVGLDDYLVARDEEEVKHLINGAGTLFDAALSMVTRDLSSDELELRMQFCAAVIAMKPMQADENIERLQGHVRGLGRTPPGKRDIRLMMKLSEQRDKDRREHEKPTPEQLAAELLKATRHGQRQLQTLYTIDGQLHRYVDGIYERLQDTQALTWVTQWLHKRQLSKITRNLVQDLLFNLKAMTDLSPDRSLPVHLGEGSTGSARILHVANGWLDLARCRSDKLWVREATPELLSTVRMPVKVQAGAGCPSWDQFLQQVFEGDRERIELLQEWFGYHLDPELHLEKFAIFLGNGANGKSVAAKVLQAMLGPGSVVSITMDRLGDQFVLGQLRGARANVVGDLDDLSRANEGMLKALVSREVVTADVKYGQHFTFTPTTRHTFLTNRFPRFRDSTDGLWRRVLLVPFGWQVPEGQRDPGLANRIIESELPGVLNWSLAGRERLQANQLFTAPVAAQNQLEEHRRAANTVAGFVAEACTIGPTLRISRKILYQEYRNSCRAQGCYPLNFSNFGRELASVVPTLGNERPRVDGHRHRYYTGVSLPSHIGQCHKSLTHWRGNDDAEVV
jgi:P4 family phage/plasmid primase-like protien